MNARNFLALLILGFFSLLTTEAKPVRNVIFLIGDGMGLNQVYSAAWQQGYALHMMSETDHCALQETYSLNKKVTDSAASGTALACGIKTNNYMIGMAPDSTAVESILHQAARNGKATGIVVTCAIQHATPAAFVAHQPNRNMYEEIAWDFVQYTPDLFIGGGTKYFEKRKDKRNLSDSLRAKGYCVAYSMEEAKASKADRFAVMLADEHLPEMTKGRGNYLPEAVAFAIEKLSASKNGFFLMVEGSQIDFSCHNNDIEGSLAETLDFDQAVAVALEFARRDKNTLVVITADHETGGLSIIETATQPASDKSVKVKFTSTGHTGVPVPIYAFGPGAENYQGWMNNSDHKSILSRLMKLK